MGVVLAILAPHHLVIGTLIGPSIHFKVVLIIPPSGVETDTTSAALALRRSLIVVVALIALVTTLIRIPLIVVMLRESTLLLHTIYKAMVSLIENQSTGDERQKLFEDVLDISYERLIDF